MAVIRLSRSEAEGGQLPPVCICCGEPSCEVQTQIFADDPWLIHLLTSGPDHLLLAFFLRLVVPPDEGKRFRLQAPLCAAHRNHWSRRRKIILLGCLVLPLALVALLLVTNIPGDVLIYLKMALAWAFLGWLLLVIILQFTSVTWQAMTTQSITLKRVSPTFVDAVESQRLQNGSDTWPEEQLAKVEEEEARRKRGIWLALWLIFAILVVLLLLMWLR